MLFFRKSSNLHQNASQVGTEMPDHFGYRVTAFDQVTQANSAWPSLCG